MDIVTAVRGQARELWIIFLVAIGVALATTIATSVLDHVHQVDAETLVAKTDSATAGPAAGTQTLVLKDWGVQFTMPLEAELPLMSYTPHAGSSIGLSAADISRLGAVCSASQNALGAFIRFPQGAYASAPHPADPIEYFIGTVGGYDYVYQMPQSDCATTVDGARLTNRETSIIQNALSTLSPIGQ